MPNFKTALDASSYLHPDRKGPYSQPRQEMIQQILERGYEYSSLSEHPVAWAEDQDPSGHVMFQAYFHITSRCFIRVWETFEEQLKERFAGFMNGGGIGAVSKSYNVSVKRVAKYPDLLITSFRLTEVRPDRYLGHYSVWSVRQKALVADFDGWVVFFNHRTGKAANLLEEGGVYSDLYSALQKRCDESKEVEGQWRKKQKGAAAGGSKL